ncbi:reverse transcriptase domain-containing protein [Xanthomonas euvesicatoria]|uniref:reverse transcriptase domain-containing protein n=1 Tax=Xanthomonas euvesicatoria TaxID=456327 RepID=UPI001C468BA6|nr:reverse transcriptase domain-containing protein [Xanthomonas euvesicatoria]MBV6865449.1 reverse transcriptase family protein [Xanthomonas campestris pv. coriandri]MCE4327707.1 reverse transcriptase family protein [Xanthomonas campestris pv. coriandri]
MPVKPPSLSNRSLQFLAIRTRADLANWIGLSEKALLYILYKLSPERKYTTFLIKKRNGQFRRISAPQKALKFSQHQISLAIQEITPPRHIAKGYVKGKSISDHARQHVRKKIVVISDLKNFFPSINFGRVRGLFLSPPYSFPTDIATILAQISCKDGELPQGSPSSPAISNAICRKLDRQILQLASRNRVSVSRYADDICFSSNKKISLSICDTSLITGDVAGQALRGIIQNNGFQVNDAKFHRIPYNQRQMVTGLVVNEGISIPRKWRRQLRAILHLRSKFDDPRSTEIVNSWSSPQASRSGKITSVDHLIKGKASFAKHIDRTSGRRVVESLHRGYPSLSELFPRVSPEFPVRIMTEGSTDLIHLDAALQRYEKQLELFNISIKLHNYIGDTGDVDVLSTLRRIAKVDVDELTIGLFDCDNPRLMKEISLEAGSYVRLGRMVFAAALAPPNSSTVPPFCIESLYPREQSTRRTKEGRRLFFGDEFDKSGKFIGEDINREFPQKTAVALSEKVYSSSDPSTSLTLSKVDFANMVSSGAHPFEDIDFSGFLPTLNLLRAMIDDATRHRYRGKER